MLTSMQIRHHPSPHHHFLSPAKLLARMIDIPGGRSLTRKHQRHKCLTLNKRIFCACIVFFKKGPRISRKGDQLLSCQRDFSCLPSASFPPPDSQSSSYRACEESPDLLPGILCWVLAVRAEAGASQQSRPCPAGVPLHSQLPSRSALEVSLDLPHLRAPLCCHPPCHATLARQPFQPAPPPPLHRECPQCLQESPLHVCPSSPTPAQPDSRDLRILLKDGWPQHHPLV